MDQSTGTPPDQTTPADTRQYDNAPRSRAGRKHHKYRPNLVGDRRGSGTSTLANEERMARNRVRAQLRVVQLLTRAV